MMVDEVVIRRFRVLYGAPDTVDPKAFADEYRRAFEAADQSVLAEAVNRAIDAHPFSSKIWPSIGELRRLVDVVALERMNAKRRYDPPAEAGHRVPTLEERARVGALVAGLAAKLRADRDDDPKVTMTAEEWARGAKPAWDERMATSETARQLALPKTLRRL